MANGFDPASLGLVEIEPAQQGFDPASLGLVEVSSSPESFNPEDFGLVTEDQFAELQYNNIADEFDTELADAWREAKINNPALPSFNEFLSQDADKTALQKTGDFVAGAGRGLSSIAGSLVRNAVRRGKTLAFGSPQERLDMMIEDVKVGAEGLARNVVGIGKAAENLAGAIGDFAVSDIEEKRREFRRKIENEDLQNRINKGIIIDPKTVDEDALAVAEVVSDPLNLTGPIGQIGRMGKLGIAAQKMGQAPRSIARGVIKGTAKVAGKPLGFTMKTVGSGAEKLGKAVKQRGKSALSTTAIVDVAGTGGKATATALGGIVGGKTAELAGRGLKNLGVKTQAVASALANPTRQKRFLDILHQEHGSKLAGIASRLGGTQAGDVLFNAVVDGTQAGILNAAEANLRGLDAGGLGEAFGTGAAFGGALGATLGESGAGASTRLVDPLTGEMTARSKGSFNLAQQEINSRKSQALMDIDQSKKLEAMPNEVKAALGQAQEAGFLPDDIILLDNKDFGRAVEALKSKPDVAGEFNNGALYFADDNVIMLNSDQDFSGAEGLRIIGEELGHVAMTQVMKSDPSIIQREAKRFEDPKGRALQTDTGEVKVNKELSNFVDAYNREADASGAPRIESFEQAVVEYYGAQAGIDMASNQSVFSPKMPVWAQKVVHAGRQQLLNFMGKQPRNTPSYAKSIDQAANTPTGKYVREQYRIWQQEARTLNKAVDDALKTYTSPKDVKTRKGAVDDLKNDPVSTGQPVIAPELKKQTKLREGDLIKTAKNAGIPIERGQAVIRGAIPENVKTVWVEQFPKSKQAEARAWIDKVEADALNRQAMTFRYETKTGPRQSPELRRRYAVAEGGFVINKKNEIQMQVRDMDAINANIQVAMQEGRTGNKTADQIQTEVLVDLQQFDNNPDFEVSDQTRALMGEKRKRDGKSLEGAWQGWDVPNNSERRTTKNFDVDTMIGYAPAQGDALFGQPRGQRGLVFAHPAFHGSPSKPFDKFSLSKIGTGEGNQAFGHGLYFTDSKQVANIYRSTLSKIDHVYEIDGKKIDIMDLDWADRNAVEALAKPGAYGTPEVYIARLEDQGVSQENINKITKSFERFRDRVNYREEVGGTTFKVDLKPKQEDYLLWDKPLSEQSPKVREALKDVIESVKKINPGVDEGQLKGQGIYNLYTEYRGGSQPAASEALLDRGIRGIKYLDRASRDKGEGTHNFVIFDDFDIEILQADDSPASTLELMRGRRQ